MSGGLLARLWRPQRTATHPVTEQEQDDRTVTVADVPLRQYARLRGHLMAVGEQASDSSRWLEAVLYDGTGEMGLVWMGRRSITGLETGHEVAVEGFVTLFGGRPAIYNPKYRIIPGRV
ncbi:OB-fold nucleic acid binding domain-containing protein [Luteococcus sp.]|uniref:OB-fold nucleic acid binding domain-containing protein n=1 Tax=Luteococcus sp. TaxID=1969402 RepID=UPI00373588A2